jgi:hypothetical protein
MILHAFNANNSPGSLHWWAVHLESLTPLLIHLNGAKRRLIVEIAAHPPGAFVTSHPGADASPDAIAAQALADVRSHFSPHISLHRATLTTPEILKPPEYLVAWNIQGEKPALCRTVNPHLIYTIGHEGDEEVLGNSLAWRSLTEISSPGWIYWWEDCQQAYETLGPQLTAADVAAVARETTARRK